MNRIPRTELVCLGLILCFAAGFRLATINRPFDRDPEGCGAFYGLVSRNYLRYDLSQSLGLPIISMGTDAPPIFYANHPPTTPLMIAAVHWMTGYRGGYESLPGEWQTRFPAAIFTMGCVVVIYALIRRRATGRAALLASAIFAALPMTLYYGGQPDVINTQLAFFALLTIAAYERFSDQPNAKHLAYLMLAFTGAGLMDWPAYYLLPVLCLHYAITHPPRKWGWIIAFGLFGTLLFAALYSHLAIGKGDWKWMASEVERRTGGATDSARKFSLAEWFGHAVWGICVARHSVVVCSLAIVGIAMAATRRFSGKADRFTALLLAWAILHVLIGRQGVYQHEWWWWPLTPAIAIAAAMAADGMGSRFDPKQRASTALVVVLLVLFAGWNSYATIREMNSPNRINKGGVEYSLAELGEVIRASTPPNRTVLVAESDLSLGFWYYADRAVKRHVWDPGTFEQRLADNQVDLSFEAKGPFPRPAAAMIVPKSYLAELAPLLNHLNARYPKKDEPKFLVYDLSTALAAN